MYNNFFIQHFDESSVHVNNIAVHARFRIKLLQEKFLLSSIAIRKMPLYTVSATCNEILLVFQKRSTNIKLWLGLSYVESLHLFIVVLGYIKNACDQARIQEFMWGRPVLVRETMPVLKNLESQLNSILDMLMSEKP